MCAEPKTARCKVAAPLARQGARGPAPSPPNQFINSKKESYGCFMSGHSFWKFKSNTATIARHSSQFLTAAPNNSFPTPPTGHPERRRGTLGVRCRRPQHNVFLWGGAGAKHVSPLHQQLIRAPKHCLASPSPGEVARERRRGLRNEAVASLRESPLSRLRRQLPSRGEPMNCRCAADMTSPRSLGGPLPGFGQNKGRSRDEGETPFFPSPLWFVRTHQGRWLCGQKNNSSFISKNSLTIPPRAALTPAGHLPILPRFSSSQSLASHRR